VSIDVLIADDHGVLRAGIRGVLESQPDMRVLGEVDRADRVVDAAAAADVVLLDLTMPGGGGLSVITELVKHTRARVLVLSMHEESGYVHRAMAAGAHGYVAKGAAADDLLDAIRATHAGEVPLLVSVVDADDKHNQVSSMLGQLSRREREVLKHIAQGYTNQQTADRLRLSIKTVEGYRARLARKLDAQDRVDLVRVALASGLLDD